jgi:hypothetical protein
VVPAATHFQCVFEFDETFIQSPLIITPSSRSCLIPKEPYVVDSTPSRGNDVGLVLSIICPRAETFGPTRTPSREISV